MHLVPFHLVASVVLSAVANAATGPAPTTGYSSVVSHCQDLLNFTGNDEAPTVVKYSTYMPKNITYGYPAYCEVSVAVAQYVDIIYRLPANGKDWSGLFTGQGCGGPCGYIRMDDQSAGTDTNGTSWSKDYLKKGFVVSFTDMGHNNSDYKFGSYLLDSWQWALNNRTAEINFGYMATHYQSIVGKLLTKLYYGVDPRLSIFKGGSTGGRQAFVAASKFPADWDHIIAAYPAINETGIGLFTYSYWGTANTDRKTMCSYLKTADLTTLHEAALKSCDKVDGLSDGIITYPDLCQVNWDYLRCGNKLSLFNSTACFTEDKISAAKRVYLGPRDASGASYGYQTFLPGTELNWGSMISESCVPNSYFNQSIDFARHISFRNDDEKPTSWTPWDIDYEKDSKLAAYMEETFLAGSSVDLTSFKNNGGKMIFFQGLADYQVMAGWSVEHYNRLLDFFGQEALDGFFRFFTIPGQYHSFGTGVGASANLDLYTVLLKWVDQGIAPEVVKAQHIEEGNFFERPVYRWPNMAQYVGGDPTAWTSFKSVKRTAAWGAIHGDWLSSSA